MLNGPSRQRDDLLDQLKQLLCEFEKKRDVASLRELTILLVGIGRIVHRLGKSVAVAGGLSATSARARIRGYLEAIPNQVVEGDELAAISGIAQYARRVRELREGCELDIRTGPGTTDPDTRKELRPGQYILIPFNRPRLKP